MYKLSTMNLNSLLLMGLFAILITSTLIFSEYIKKLFNIELELARKIFHLSAGTITIILIYSFDSKLPLIVLSCFFIIFLTISIKHNIFSIQNRGRGYGSVSFAIGYLILSIFFWEFKEIMVSAVAILTYGDAFAAIIGKKFGKRRYSFGKTTKSLEGSIAFFIISFICVFTVLMLYRTGSLYNIILTSAICALLTTCVEAVSVTDIDNLTVPLFAAITIFIVFNNDVQQNNMMAIVIVIMSVISFISYKLKYVDIPASIGVYIIGFYFFSIGGYQWLIPILFYFISVSILGHMSRKHFQNPFVEKEGTRDIFQIYSKGVLSLLIIIAFYFTKNDWLYYIFLSIIASNNSDTWASSFGSYSNKDPIVSLPFFRKVPKGISGGVTSFGMVGAIFGSVIIASFVFLFPQNYNSLLFFSVITLAGFLGNIIDSVLGSTTQGLYKCKACGKFTEKKYHCAISGLNCELEIVKGFKFVNGDSVNFISGVISMLITIMLIKLFIM